MSFVSPTFRVRFAALTAIAVALFHCPAPSATAAEIPGVTKAMQATVDQREIAGAVTLVASPDKILHLSAVGLADIATGKPMRDDALFLIASMTKPLTASASLIVT